MKKLIFIISLLFSTVICNANSVETKAKDAYSAGEFEKTVEMLEAEKKAHLDKGEESATLYYNLGNAYFRNNDLAQAILYYEKAHLLDPGDRDIRHNIEFANTLIEDKIIPVNDFFLVNWFKAVQNCFPSNTWTVIAIVQFVLFLCCIALFIFVQSVNLKKTTFYIGIVLLPLLIFANIFAINQKHKLTNRNTAIIMVGSAPAVSAPSNDSKEVFVVHSGTKVTINKEDNDWVEVELSSGHVGWIEKTKLEII